MFIWLNFMVVILSIIILFIFIWNLIPICYDNHSLYFVYSDILWYSNENLI